MQMAMVTFIGGMLFVFCALAGAWWCQRVYKPSADKLCPECAKPIVQRCAKCPECKSSLIGRRLHSRADARNRLYTISATLGTTGVLLVLLGSALSMASK